MTLFWDFPVLPQASTESFKAMRANLLALPFPIIVLEQKKMKKMKRIKGAESNLFANEDSR